MMRSITSEERQQLWNRLDRLSLGAVDMSLYATQAVVDELRNLDIDPASLDTAFIDQIKYNFLWVAQTTLMTMTTPGTLPIPIEFCYILNNSACDFLNGFHNWINQGHDNNNSNVPYIEQVGTNKVINASSPILHEAIKKPVIHNLDIQFAQLSHLKKTLVSLQEAFPHTPNKKGSKANMGALISILISDIESFERNLEGKMANLDVDYKHFKKTVDFHFNNDNRGLEAKKTNSIFYPVNYAIMSLFRAFFRMFDILIAGLKTISGTEYQTQNDKSGYKPFFKLPEESTIKHAVALEQEFNNSIQKIDAIRLQSVEQVESPNKRNCI